MAMGNRKPYYVRTGAGRKPAQTQFKSCEGWKNPTAKNHCGGLGQTRMMGIGATVCPQCGAPQVERKK